MNPLLDSTGDALLWIIGGAFVGGLVLGIAIVAVALAVSGGRGVTRVVRELARRGETERRGWRDAR